MTIQAKYVGVAVILMALYLFTLWFETIHKLCLMGSVINILINYQSVNPLKKRLILKSETVTIMICQNSHCQCNFLICAKDLELQLLDMY